MQNDFWRDIPGTGGKYQASRGGDVRHVWPSGKTTPLRPYLVRGESHKRHRYTLYIHMRIGGKDWIATLMSVIAMTFKGAPPPGMCWHHANGCQFDNRPENIQPIDRHDLGRRSGAASRRKSVEMLDRDGNVVELYTSAREAARANYISYEAVIQRCYGRIKNPYSLTGYTFQYEDSPHTGRKKVGNGKR